MSDRNAMSDDDDPKCDKCGAPICTGLMAAFCPYGKECEFWTPAVDQFLADFKDPPKPSSEAT